ncbi:MAG TPA: Rrf2 family transcriptional regulator [Noviherbaspirillum sp.]|uniref:Rrf2 family transcriptional regulator n=1 Tax=Noviherbaspirillum sp. TaxID=1926288 RepID=UPI002D3D8051|nr:Rrf2 family transcriptional regulator [Noviherbaspirillum sp.]HYD96944.1 Rrf2 family transcriptional regulator [Noviherbaspirillum sp.]
MSRHEEFILGNATLHLQLSTALAVMTQLVCNASCPPTAQQLSDSLNVSLRYLRKLLRALAAGGLLEPHPRRADTWICTRPPHTVSLADIYHSLAVEDKDTPAPFIPVAQPDASTSTAELLMMQATMAINQVVLQHLQRFDLGRLKIAESAQLYTASLQEKAMRSVAALSEERADLGANFESGTDRFPAPRGARALHPPSSPGCSGLT